MWVVGSEVAFTPDEAVAIREPALEQEHNSPTERELLFRSAYPTVFAVATSAPLNIICRLVRINQTILLVCRICEGLEFFGIEIDETRNATDKGVISKPTSRVVVRDFHTDEALLIALLVYHSLGLGMASE